MMSLTAPTHDYTSFPVRKLSGRSGVGSQSAPKCSETVVCQGVYSIKTTLSMVVHFIKFHWLLNLPSLWMIGFKWKKFDFQRNF